LVEAVYDAPFLAHAQLEPPSAIARFNDDGTLDLWAQNQQPDVFQAVAAGIAGVEPHQVNLHSPTLGGFFGRHFLYGPGNPFPQAIMLAKAVGQPVKVIWSREEEFLRDALRPLGVARLRAGLDADGMPVALNAAEAVGEGPFGRWVYRQPDAADSSAVEGLAGKPYGFAAKSHQPRPCADPGRHRLLAFGRPLDERLLLRDLPRRGRGRGRARSLRAAHAAAGRQAAQPHPSGDGGGGLRRMEAGPFEAADGTMHARGVALASAFNSEVATIAEVSVERGEVVVHEVWVAIDPGSIVNPAIVEAQMKSCVAQGVSAALMEEVVYRDGMPQARNFDGYTILPPHRMPRVNVSIVESGEAKGGIGEPGLPGVSPAIANAVSTLTGQRIRSLPLSKQEFGETG
jgi:isoquinoline 1-oxidoreductase subunit beta